MNLAKLPIRSIRIALLFRHSRCSKIILIPLYRNSLLLLWQRRRRSRLLLLLPWLRSSKILIVIRISTVLCRWKGRIFDERVCISLSVNGRLTLSLLLLLLLLLLISSGRYIRFVLERFLVIKIWSGRRRKYGIQTKVVHCRLSSVLSTIEEWSRRCRLIRQGKVDQWHFYFYSANRQRNSLNRFETTFQHLFNSTICSDSFYFCNMLPKLKIRYKLVYVYYRYFSSWCTNAIIGIQLYRVSNISIILR